MTTHTHTLTFLRVAAYIADTVQASFREAERIACERSFRHCPHLIERGEG